jgi:PadR family transcriptional regulator, regulatory protein PadR
MRRKPGALLPLEVSILGAAVRCAMDGRAEFHGFELARMLADATGSQRLTAHGTLYKALGRLADAGLLESRWENADAALAAGRPRRRLYSITVAGERALTDAVVEGEANRTPVRRLGIESS